MDVKKIHDGFLEGLVFDDSQRGSSYLPDDYCGEYEYMNFPITSVKVKFVKYFNRSLRADKYSLSY